MKYSVPGTILLSLLLLWGACANQRENQLVGSWTAVEILEEGEPLKVDPAEVQFEFRSDRTYTYRSTLNYREDGVFRIQAEYLFTRDSAAASEKAVLIERFESDTLVLGMEDQDKARTLKLARSKGE